MDAKVGQQTAFARDIVVAHASDVHVDNDYTARLYGGDGTGGLRAALHAARKVTADVLLLAGDTFDSHRLPDHVLIAAAHAIREHALPVVLLPGNHDPAIPEAVYHRAAFHDLDLLHILGVTHEEAVHLPHLDLEIWGRPHRDWFDMAPLADPRARSTRWQIAMAHGHYLPPAERAVERRPSWLFGDEEIEATGADYVALGHWNRKVRVGGGTVPAWYCGSPDYARSINVVRLRADGSVAVEHEPLDLPDEHGSVYGITGGAD